MTLTRNLERVSAAKADIRVVDEVRSAKRPLPKAAALGGTTKRCIDIVLSAAALVSLLPMFVTVAVAVKLCDGGPIFFKHRRIGHKGRLFNCLKFRTMCIDADVRLKDYLLTNAQAAAEWRTTQKLKDDPRLTPIGTALRQTSLDELPQLINVLRGEMSLVGPRPVEPDELARYGRNAVFYLSARPGLTGRWQVSGRNDVSYAERVRLDTTYCTTWSLIEDFLIMLRTVPVLFSRHGSY